MYVFKILSRRIIWKSGARYWKFANIASVRWSVLDWPPAAFFWEALARRCLQLFLVVTSDSFEVLLPAISAFLRSSSLIWNCNSLRKVKRRWVSDSCSEIKYGQMHAAIPYKPEWVFIKDFHQSWINCVHDSRKKRYPKSETIFPELKSSILISLWDG